MQRVALARLTSSPGVALWTTTEVVLHERGPLAPIWSLDVPQRRQAACPDGSLRQCLLRLSRNMVYVDGNSRLANPLAIRATIAYTPS